MIVKLLKKNNYSADAVYNGEDAVAYLNTGNYDAAVIDVMMPKLDGLTALKILRRSGNQVPVLILSAKSQDEDIILGLDSGANYYLEKPFRSARLLAAIRAITRTQNEVDTTICFGNLSLNRATYLLSTPYGSFPLTNKEFQIAEILLSNPCHIISADHFIEKVWGYETDIQVSVVWVYICNLRKKLNALNTDVHIKFSRNIGYSLEKSYDKALKD